MKHPAQYAFPLFMVIVLLTFFPNFSGAQFQNGNGHPGVYPDATVHNSAEMLWKFNANAAIRSTPTVTETRVIFGATDGSVYALSHSGILRWKFTADGSVSSSAVLWRNAVLFVSRKNTLYSVSADNGRLIWKKNLGTALPYDWGFDYYVGSVTVDHDRLYVGSADGNLYSLSAADGKEQWKFRTDCIIRSTPAVDEASVYFGDMNGKLFCLDKRSGTKRWSFVTIGDTLNNEQYGFDRKALISSPTVSGENVFVGSRDGYLYAVDKITGTERWKFDYTVSWVLSTVAVKKNILVTGTSDGRFVHALDARTGKELWRFMTQATVWASPFISGNDRVVIPSNDGNLYCLELADGEEVWRKKIGPQIFSSAVPMKEQIFFGSDDGFFYSIGTKHVPPSSIRRAKRAVFWMKDPVFQTFRGGMDVAVRDHFIKEGYEYYDETDVKDFLLKRISSDTASVLVFATNYFLPALVKDTLGSNILREYLRTGGRMVMLGMNPAAYQLDSSGRQIVGLNFLQARQLTGIPYQYKDLRSHGGFTAAFVSDEGRRFGLQSNFTSVCGLPKDSVTTVLAVDENGNAAAWIRTYSPQKHSGYMQLFLTPERIHTLPEIQKAAEYGL